MPQEWETHCCILPACIATASWPALIAQLPKVEDTLDHIRPVEEMGAVAEDADRHAFSHGF